MSSDTIADKAAAIFGVMLVFGAPFISINYCIGYLFKKSDSAFKYSVIVMMAVALLPVIVGGIVAFIDSSYNPEGLINTVAYVSPPYLLVQVVSTIMSNTTGQYPQPEDTTSTFDKIFPQLLAMVIQVPVFMTLAIFIDYKVTNSFKGTDSS